MLNKILIVNSGDQTHRGAAAQADHLNPCTAQLGDLTVSFQLVTPGDAHVY